MASVHGKAPLARQVACREEAVDPAISASGPDPAIAGPGPSLPRPGLQSPGPQDGSCRDGVPASSAGDRAPEIVRAAPAKTCAPQPDPWQESGSSDRGAIFYAAALALFTDLAAHVRDAGDIVEPGPAARRVAADRFGKGI